MYIIELIIKMLTQRKKTQDYSPMSSDVESNYEACEHLFMPIDSTNESLACTKCGLLVKRGDLKYKDFFN